MFVKGLCGSLISRGHEGSCQFRGFLVKSAGPHDKTGGASPTSAWPTPAQCMSLEIHRPHGSLRLPTISETSINKTCGFQYNHRGANGLCFRGDPRQTPPGMKSSGLLSVAPPWRTTAKEGPQLTKAILLGIWGPFFPMRSVVQKTQMAVP